MRAIIEPRGALGALDLADHLVVEHDLLERHGDGLGGLEADGGGALVLVVDLGDVELADDDLLVRDAEPDAARKAAVLEEVAEPLGQGVDVGHLAVADHAGGEVEAGGTDDAVGARLDGGHVAPVEVEAYGAAVGVLAHRESHGGSLQRRYRPFGAWL
jgi:hypothetical protein